jgi:hypothetical protein
MSQAEHRRSLLSGGGFTRLYDSRAGNDATVEIPLTQVKSHGQRSVEQTAYQNEKTSAYTHKGARPRSRAQGPSNADDEGSPLTFMGKLYDKIFNFSVVTRYFLYVLPLGLIIAVPIVIGSTAAPHAAVGPASQTDHGFYVKIKWLFTWIEVVWLGLWVSKLFAKCLPRIFQVLAGAVSPGVRKYSIAIKRLEIPIALVGWAVIALATFLPIITNNPDRKTLVDPKNASKGTHTQKQGWEDTMQNILGAAVIASLVFLGEKVFIVLVSVQYHQQTFDRKIKDSKRRIDLLSQLLDASHALFPPYCPEFAQEDYTINDSLGLSRSGKNTGGRSGIATPMKLLHNVGRVGDKITAAFGKVAHEVTGKAVFNVSASHSITVEALEKKKSSEALARRIWMSLVVEGKEALYQEDVVEVLADRPEEEAVESFAAIDRDGNGDVTLDEMILTVCEMGRERKAIANSLHSIDSCITALDRMLLVMVFFAVIFVFIAFLNNSFVGLLATAGTALLSLSFVFSSTITEIFSSCIFLFVKHPFDVDDNVKIGTQQLIVERISLLYTVFKDVQTHTVTQAPNRYDSVANYITRDKKLNGGSVLNSVWIDNISRSGKMRELLLIYISFDTTLEDIELLRREMQYFVTDKDNSRDFDGLEVEVTGIHSMDKMELKVEIQHKSNWQNETLRAARRSKFMCALVLALRKVPIYAPGGGGAALGSASQPTYSVSVTDAEASAARATFDDNKAASHMNAPQKPKSVELPQLNFEDGGNASGNDAKSANASTLQSRNGLASNTEQSALAALTARSPTSDPSRDWDDEKRNKPATARAEMTSPMSPMEIDEVHSILRRQSTRGKRQSPLPGTSLSGESSSMAQRAEYEGHLAPGNPPMPQQPAEARTAGSDLAHQISPPRNRPAVTSPVGIGESGVVSFPAPPSNASVATSYSQRPPQAQPRYEMPPAGQGGQVGQELPRPMMSSARSPSPGQGRSRAGTNGTSGSSSSRKAYGRDKVDYYDQ